MASIYKRKNNDGTTCWRAVVRIKGHPPVCNHFDRKQEAEDWSLEIEHQIKIGQYKFGRQGAKQTFDHLVERYIADSVLDHHKSKSDSVRHLVYFRSRLGKYTLARLTPELLLDERKRLSELLDGKGRKRSAATVNRYMASLSGILTYACRHLRWMNENPCFNLIKLKEHPHSRRILTDDEATALLTVCKESCHPYLYSIVLIAITTGMRSGEILSLTWSDVDFDKKLLHIKTSKNGRSRYVAIMDSALKTLESLCRLRDPLKPLVFASRTVFGRIDIKKPWQKALKLAGIKDFVFHGLRHHYASRGGQMGASSQQLQSQLGHSSSQMTDHYTHLEAESTRYIGESIEKKLLGGVYEPVRKGNYPGGRVDKVV
jgi:integrase